MIEKWMENWHQQVRGEFAGGLDALLADDVVFYSPIVFSPQKGVELTKMYLQAAGATFEAGTKRDTESDAKPARPESKFHYTKEVVCGNHAVLEFETEMDGKFVNGVDIITWNDQGQIVEFKVMIRPLQAINLMHQKMAAMLEEMNG